MSRYPSIVCILFGGPTYVMDTPSGPVRFEWHSYCGPMPVRLDGSGRRIGERHPFWVLVTRWARSGKATDGIRCVVPDAVKCESCSGSGRGKHLGGRNYEACAACDGTGEGAGPQGPGAPSRQSESESSP